MALDANNNPGYGAVPSQFIALASWRVRSYGRRAVSERFLHGVWVGHAARLAPPWRYPAGSGGSALPPRPSTASLPSRARTSRRISAASPLTATPGGGLIPVPGGFRLPGCGSPPPGVSRSGRFRRTPGTEHAQPHPERRARCACRPCPRRARERTELSGRHRAGRSRRWR